MNGATNAVGDVVGAVGDVASPVSQRSFPRDISFSSSARSSALLVTSPAASVSAKRTLALSVVSLAA